MQTLVVHIKNQLMEVLQETKSNCSLGKVTYMYHIVRGVGIAREGDVPNCVWALGSQGKVDTPNRSGVVQSAK